MRFIRDSLDRLEPWAMFLSIVAILLWPHGKAAWWTIILVVGLARLVRAWRSSWAHFSLETIGDVVSAGGFVVSVVLVYCLLHRVAPTFVHDRPALPELAAGPWVLGFETNTEPGRLEIVGENDDYRVSVFASRDAKTPVVSGGLTRNQLVTGSSESFAKPIRLHRLGGSITEGWRAVLKLDRKARPAWVRVTRGAEVRFLGKVPAAEGSH